VRNLLQPRRRPDLAGLDDAERVTRGTAFGGKPREYWQAGGDPSVVWDSRGNAYYACQTFLRGSGTSPNPDQSSAFYVFRSTGNNGASWNFTGRPVVEYNDTAGTGCCLEDKQYLTVDNRSSGPYRDRIYVTWTFFAAGGTAKIFEAHSSDYGQTFSSPVLVSGPSTLCPNSVISTGNCDANQFSDPFTAPDGTLYVTWANFNNSLSGGSDNHNQILLAKSTDGGASFSAPVKVSDYYDLPDCPTYQAGQDPGRACVPEKGSATNSVFRAANYPSGAIDPLNGRIAVTFGSYINADSKESNGCTPDGLAGDGNNKFIGVKTAGACSNKILVSVSTNGGASFTGTSTDPRSLTIVNQASGQTHTDQWWQWATFMPQTEVFGTLEKLVVSYYDRQYGSDETNGNMDFSLSGSVFLSSFTTQRVTSSSMPLPTQFPNGTGNSLFFGDYTGLDVGGTTAHPIWMDTRQTDLFVCPGTALPGVPPALCSGTEPNGLTADDQDVFTASVTP
jgi:hypothetical protein